MASQLAPAAAGGVDRAAFRSSRNELASTLKAGSGIAHETRSAAAAERAQNAAAASATRSSAASSYGASAAPAASSVALPAIGSATPRTAAAARASPSPPSGAAPAATTRFPSPDKGQEEAKEGPSGALRASSGKAAAAAGAGAGGDKDKDWNLWHGAPEAQWILSVMDDIHHKLQLASLLHPDLLKERSLESMDAELLLTLKEHFQVEAQYHEFLDSELWRAAAHEPKNQELFRELDLCLADSTRTVTRLLKQHPLLVRRLRELGVKRAPATLDFLNNFARLRGLMHAQLRMTAEEERHMREQLAELKVLEEEDTARFVELTERLAVERAEHEQALAAKERKIQRLHGQISQLQSSTARDRALFDDKMREENDAAEKAFRAAEKELTKQLEQLTAQLEADGSENFRTELLYHRKKNLRAADVTQLIEKYDVDMSLKHESVVDMDACYARERKELEALSGYFAVRDAEERKIAEEHQRIRDERTRELHVERRNQQAALLVQSLYKPYMQKYGPKEPKKKKQKAKKDPFAGLRGRPKPKGPTAEETAAAAAAAAASASAAAASDGSTLNSPAASGPEDSEGEAQQSDAQ